MLVQLRNRIFDLIEFKVNLNSHRWLITATLNSTDRGERLAED